MSSQPGTWTPRCPTGPFLTSRAQRRVIVTMDNDFGEMVFGEGSATEGVVLLRTDDAPSSEKQRILSGIVREHGEQMAVGVL